MQGGLVSRIVGFAKRFVRQLFFLMVMVHRPKHLVVNAVEHGFALPVARWIVPRFKLLACGLRNGNGYAGMVNTGLFVLGVISAGEQDGQVVRVFPRRRLLMLSGQFHTLTLANPTAIEGRNHRCDVFLHPEVFLGVPTDKGKERMNHINGFDLVKTAKFCQGVLAIGAGERHGSFEPGHLQNAHTGLLRRGLFVGASDDGHVVPALGKMPC